jgi:hypothetical protein
MPCTVAVVSPQKLSGAFAGPNSILCGRRKYSQVTADKSGMVALFDAASWHPKGTAFAAVRDFSREVLPLMHGAVTR